MQCCYDAFKHMSCSQLIDSGLCIVKLSSANMQTHLCCVNRMLACQHAFWLQFKDESFHIAFDKGALDALMGEDTDAAGVAGGKLLSEVQRVLDSCDGQYLCVTLGQTHVLSEHAIYTVAVSVAVSAAVSTTKCSIMQKCITCTDCNTSLIGHLLSASCPQLIQYILCLGWLACIPRTHCSEAAVTQSPAVSMQASCCHRLPWVGA